MSGGTPQNPSLALLAQALRHARQAPFWRDRLASVPDPLPSIEAFERVPVTRKQRLFAPDVTPADRVVGPLTDVLAAMPSSGTTGGDPVFCLLDEPTAAAGAARLHRLLARYFDVGRGGPTLIVGGLPGGTSLPPAPGAAHVVHAGPRVEVVRGFVAGLAARFAQVLLVAEPRFAKEAVEDLVSSGAAAGVRLRVAIGGEYVPEALRDHLAGLLGVSVGGDDTYIGSSYGMGEVGLNLLHETDLTIRLRRLLREDAALRLRVCGTSLPTSPMLLTWEPEHVHIEAPDRTLLVTTVEVPRFQPVVRYDTGDRGGVVSADGIAALRAVAAVPEGGRLAWLYGRDAVLPGPRAGVWPAAVQEALLSSPPRARAVTGAVQLRHHPADDPKGDPRVQILVEAVGPFDAAAAAADIREVVLDRRLPHVVPHVDPEHPFRRRAPHEYKPRAVHEPLRLVHIGMDDPRFREVVALRRRIFSEAATYDDHDLLTDDEDAWAEHWIVEGGSGADRTIVAAVRSIHRPDGPFEDEEPLRLDFWRGTPDAPGFRDVDMAQAGRLIAVDSARGRMASTLLMRHMYLLLRGKGVRLLFLDCDRSLVPMYESWGYRRFREPYVHPVSGHRYETMVCFLEDVAYLEGIDAHAGRWARALLDRFRSDGEARRWFEENIGAEYAVDLHRVVQRIAAPFRHYFSNEELRGRSAGFERRTHAAGDVVVREGAADRAFFIVEEGTLIASRRDGDRELELGRLTSGDFFGELAALSGTRRSATITVADGGGQLLVLTPDQLREELGRVPSLCISMLRVLAERFGVADGSVNAALPRFDGDGPLFTRAEIEGLRRLPRVREVAFEPGASILEAGTRGSETFFILEGSVEVVDAEGRLPLGVGRSVGDWGALARLPRSADVVGGPGGARLLRVDLPFLVGAIETVPGIGIKMLLHVAAMLYRRRAG